jgi:moderate conductance mechanosensitive channel
MREILDAIESSVTGLDQQDWIGLGVTLVIGVALIVAARRLLPRLCRATCAAIDRRVPANLVSCAQPAGRILSWTATLVILFLMGVTMATIAGLETRGLTDTLQGWVADAGEWLLPVAIRLAVLVAITLLVLRVIRAALPPSVSRYLARRSHRRGKDEAEAAKRTTTLAGVAVAVASWFVIIMATFVGLSELGFDIGPILAGAGVVGLAVGFGAQHLVRDFFAGLFILLEDQYRVGDVVEVGGKAGLVEDINLRRTVLRDLDGIVHTIANGEIKAASNFTKVTSRVNIDVEVAYKQDLDHAIEVINRVGAEMFDERVTGLREPIKVLRVDAFAASGIAIKCLGETEAGTQWAVGGEFRRRLKAAFDAEGIEIPFPHRTLYWGTDQPALRPDAQPTTSKSNGSSERQATASS